MRRKVTNMLCEHCQQREAVITISQKYQSGQDHHYCEICANQLYPFTAQIKKEPISIQQLLTNWQAPKERTSPKTCETCGMTYAQFTHMGRFGCPKCYATFAAQLPKILRPIQADLQHVGHMPSAMKNEYSIKKKIEELRNKMQTAVQEERFEDAATLRDEARELESQLGGDY